MEGYIGCVQQLHEFFLMTVMIIKFDLPDVPAPTEPFVGYWSKQLFVGHFSENPFIVTLSTTYVRCVFAAREDYLAAVLHLRRVWEPVDHVRIKVSDLYRCISKFETCITGMHLAVRSMRELRKRQELTARERAAMQSCQSNDNSQLIL